MKDRFAFLRFLFENWTFLCPLSPPSSFLPSLSLPEMSRQFPRRTAKVIDSLKGPPPQTKEGGERRGRSERPSLNSPRILEIEKSFSAELNKQFVLNKVGKTCFLYTEKLKFHATTDKLHEPYNYSVGLQLIMSICGSCFNAVSWIEN